MRWRLLLACGHTIERWTGARSTPVDLREPDAIGLRHLPAGEFFCFEGHGDEPPPYRPIVDWGARRTIDFEADPEDCPEGRDPELYAITRRRAPVTKAFWRVTLECGHGEEVCTDENWNPDDGPSTVDDCRREEMIAEHEAYLSTHPTATKRERSDHDHYRRMMEAHFPMPFPERDCGRCLVAHELEAYQRLGWLKKPPSEPGPPVTKEDRLLRRLQRARAEADELEQQLRDLTGDTRPDQRRQS